MAQTGRLVAVDDSDPAIKYFGNWSEVTTNKVSLSFTTTPGASFSFAFNGTQIGVVGSIAASNGSSGALISTYSVDNATASSFIAPNSTTDLDSQEFYESPTLSAGEHVLVVTVKSASDDTPYFFDLLGYVPLTEQPSASYVSSAFATPSGAVTGGADSSSSHKSSVPIGAIVGGVVGGVALLVISIIAIFFLCRRRSGKPYFYQTAEAGDLLANEVKPFDIPPQAPSAGGTTVVPSEGPVSYYAPTVAGTHTPPVSEVGGSTYSASQSGISQRQSYAPSTTLSVANPNPTYIRGSPNQPNSKAAQAGLLSVPQQANYHQDSGVRFGGPSGSGSGAPLETPDPVDVPPMYSEN
ncbi:hypothetical protein K474DRAFT_748853 [Panus rudis PR-1116 ss-1]|nr:hypothetical protein K474DRAFT_748853 [Panus rudis PR-1116 ss-1]